MKGMNMSGIINSVIAGIVGLIVGLCVPLVKWEIKKRETKHNARRQLIKECKTIIDKDDFDVKSFIKTSYYSSIRDELTENLRKEIEQLEEIGKNVSILR